MNAEGSVNTAAFDAQQYPKIQRYPVRVGSVAIGAHRICSHQLFRTVFRRFLLGATFSLGRLPFVVNVVETGNTYALARLVSERARRFQRSSAATATRGATHSSVRVSVHQLHLDPIPDAIDPLPVLERPLRLQHERLLIWRHNLEAEARPFGRGLLYRAEDNVADLHTF